MWKLPDAVAQRFPLVARPRPACLPLAQRVHALGELADTAAKLGDASVASTVCNQAALIASDVGAPDVARTMCHQHAAAYLHAAPLPGQTAIRALEPVVNLARLQIRAGRHDDGREQLLALFDAVSAGTLAQVEDIAVPAELTVTAEDRQEVRAWLWRVLLADGTRVLTAAGRWTEALAHVEAYRGVGQRMLDGRQVAVLAALTTGNTLGADSLLTSTEPGEPWENAVTDCLTVLYRRHAGKPVDGLADLVGTYVDREAEIGMTVFDIRLGLTLLDAVGSAEDPAARRIVENLHRRTTDTQDGYAARESLAHPLFTALATDRQAQDCRDLVRSCALGSRTMPDGLTADLSAALDTSESVITRSLSGSRAHSNAAG